MAIQIDVQPRGARAYPVWIGERLEVPLATLRPAKSSRVAIVSDHQVGGLYGERVARSLGAGLPIHQLRFAAGEASKTRASKEKLEDALLELHADRRTCVVALGGGVTTDLAGFVAATLLRGVSWIALPTSLLAAVDASVGGKVGVNTPAGKNLVGCFHHPEAVIVDVTLMRSLPQEELANGLAEMVKHGVIADPTYLEALHQRADDLRAFEPRALIDMIARSVCIKADVVNQDPREADLRQVLNFGHTIGHAIELSADFAIAHGEAVAMGMSVEAEIACLMQLLSEQARDALRAVLVGQRLPIVPPASIDTSALIAATRSDKKGSGGVARYVLPSRLGAMAMGADGYAHAVSEDLVKRAIERARRCCV